MENHDLAKRLSGIIPRGSLPLLQVFTIFTLQITIFKSRGVPTYLDVFKFAPCVHGLFNRL